MPEVWDWVVSDGKVCWCKEDTAGVLLFFWLLHVFLSPPVYAIDSPVPKDAIDSCREIRSELDRLRCFDDLFNTPVYQSRKEVNPIQPTDWQASSHRWVKRIVSSQVGKQVDSDRLQLTRLSALGDDKQVDYILSIWGEGARVGEKSLLKQPLLTFQCYQDISSIQILWPEALGEKRAGVRFLVGDEVLLDTTWKVIDGKFLLISPQGLPGIEMIKQLFDQKKVHFRAWVGQQRLHATFMLEDLRNVIKPLGESCHWL